MNKDTMAEVIISIVALQEEHKELRKDLKTALEYLAGFGWSNEASREFYSMAKERWFGREDG
jgi:hypothetical protein